MSSPLHELIDRYMSLAVDNNNYHSVFVIDVNFYAIKCPSGITIGGLSICH